MPTADLPNIKAELFNAPTASKVFEAPPASEHPARILLLYGSLREHSFSRLAVEESARLLEAMGAETRIFNPPRGLPWPMPKTPAIPRFRNCGNWCSGVKAWCGAPPRNATAP